MTTQTRTTAMTPGKICTPAQRVTRSLLGYGVLAGTVFEASVLIQGLTRHGFRIAHDDASLLSNGPLGWIQIATSLVSGAMTIACAVGMRRALAGPGCARRPGRVADGHREAPGDRPGAPASSLRPETARDRPARTGCGRRCAPRRCASAGSWPG
jgi:hypothetical protein